MRSLLLLALCFACLLFLGGCIRLSIDPSSFAAQGQLSQEVSIFADPTDSMAVWIVGGIPHQGEANIAYCTTSKIGDVPECVMVVPQ